MVDGVGKLARDRRDVLELRFEACETGLERLVAGIEAAQQAGLAERDRYRVPGAPLLGGQGVVERGAATGDRLAVLGGVEAGPDVGGLARPEPRRCDLGGLMLVQLEPPRQLAWIQLQLRQRRAVRSPAVD